MGKTGSRRLDSQPPKTTMFQGDKTRYRFNHLRRLVFPGSVMSLGHAMNSDVFLSGLLSFFFFSACVLRVSRGWEYVIVQAWFLIFIFHCAKRAHIENHIFLNNLLIHTSLSWCHCFRKATIRTCGLCKALGRTLVKFWVRTRMLRQVIKLLHF